MPARRLSLSLRIQGGFAVGVLLVVGLMALFMDQALRRSLAQEDASVLRAQATRLLDLHEKHALEPGAAGRFPEKAEWRLSDIDGRPQAESPDRARLPALSRGPLNTPFEFRDHEGHVHSAIRLSLSGGALLDVVIDRSHESDLLEEFRKTLALGVLLATGLAAVLGQAVARAATAPLRSMAREAAAIGPGRLDQRLDPAHFPFELEELVLSLNAALGRLEEAFDRLSQLAIDLAHELRTPLQNLRSGLEGTLLRPAPERLPEELGSALEECGRLERLISQMVLLARSEHPATELRKEALSAAELLATAADFFGAMAEERGLALDASAPADLRFHADRPLAERALHNLVANALAHTPTGGHVRLGGEAAEGGVVLWIQDDGPGIPEPLLSRLGERWVRGSRGLGLGLAIVKGILHLHGGSMSLRSTAGTGTRVTLFFPNPAPGETPRGT